MDEIFKRRLLLALVLLTLQCHKGSEIFQKAIPNGEIVPHPCKANHVWSGVGHKNPLGGDERNPFGVAFYEAGKQWTISLCQQDSDGDGKTNGEELGDPDCIWSNGQKPSKSSGLSHPGICDPMYSPAWAGKNTWVDCTSDKFQCDPINNVEYRNQITSQTFRNSAILQGETRKECFTVQQVTFWHTVVGTAIKIGIYFHPDKHYIIVTDTRTAEVRIPVTPVPAKETTYMCMVFDLPKDGDFHLIGFEALLDNPNVVHHIVVYGCDDRSENYTTNQAEECFMSVQEGCEDIVAAWTVGIPGICYHDNVGIRIGTSGYQRAVIELHWNNPERIAGTTDRSGVKLHYTSKLRPNDAGMLMTGQLSLHIPPGKNSITIEGSCSSECTRKLTKGNIHVVAAFNHMHYLGYQGRFELIRNGSKLQDFAYDSVYSYNSPVIYNFDNPVEVRPGDELKTTCVFKSTSKSKTTVFGKSTSDEMCFSFLMYYPEQNILMKECTQWEDISTCDLDTDDNGTIHGCPTLKIFDISIPQHAEMYNSVMENCDRIGIYCREECKSVVKRIRKHPCFNGSVDTWLRTHLVELNIFPAQVHIMDFYSALDSCNLDLAFEDAKSRDICTISGDGALVGSSTGSVWCFRSFVLIFACIIRKYI